ncbi:MAG: CHAT domain-containing protein [Bacteroidales bacterium]|nr:CHAT domain-containing protein [Bacteroidales bacterium]
MKLKFILLVFCSLIITKLNAQQQHFITYSNLRPIYLEQDYQDVLKAFNESGYEKVVFLLDSLAMKSLDKKEYVDYLFYRNQQVKFYNSKQHYKEAVETAVESRKIFAAHHDTMHVEYFMSYYENYLSREPYLSKNGLSRHKLIFGRYNIIKEMGYEDLDDKENPYTDVITHLSNYMCYHGTDDDFYYYGKLAREQYKRTNYYSALTIFDRLLYSKFGQLDDMYEAIHTALIANNVILKELRKDPKEWKAKISYDRNIYNIAFKHLEIENYNEAIKLFSEIDSTVNDNNMTLKLYTNIDLANCYLQLNDTINLKRQIAKNFEMLKHKNVSLKNRVMAYHNFSRDMVDYDEALCHRLVDSAILFSKNTRNYLPMISSKMVSYYDKKQYTDIIDLCKEELPQDTINNNLVINFSFADIDDQFFENMIMAECYYNQWQKSKDKNDLWYFETYTLNALNAYEEVYKYSLNSIEYSSYQKRFEKFVSQYILRPYTNNVQFKLINKDLIVKAFSMAKSQSINNAVARLKEAGSIEASDFSKSYIENLNNIQKQKIYLKNLPSDQITQKDVIYFSDLLFENATLRNIVKNYKEEHKDSTEHSSYQNVQASEIQKQLNENQLFVDYYVDDEINSCFGLIISKDTICIKGSTESDLSKISKNFLRSVKTSDTNSKADLLISRLLLENLKFFAEGKNELIIIPHKWLHKIPFELLSMPGSKDKLITQYTILYNYSSAIWLANRNDIDLTKEYSIASFAPFFDKSKTVPLEETDSIFRGEMYRGYYSTPPLPYSKNEVKQINKLFHKMHYKTSLFTSSNATEYNFMNNYFNYPIIHLATHGLNDKKHFERSGLYFYPEDSITNNDLYDNFLSLGEVYTLNHHPDLVVLSACNTGTGAIVEGEGVMALPRGFIYAGVPNVIASLWKVHDKKTKDLMVAFYKHLLEDKVSYAEALRLAKLDCIEKGFLPLDWAGFILIGE